MIVNQENSMSEAGRELLVRYISQRDPEAFRELVQQHKDMVYATCRRVLGHDADAEDAAQNCFLALARKPQQVKGAIAGWLHRAALNAAIDLLREAKARRRREENAMKSPTAPSDPVWEQVAPAVDRAIEQLPDDLRLPIIRHYLEGRTQEQIAQELQVTHSAISKRLQRGTDELRRLLTKAGVTLSVAALASLLSANAAQAAPLALTAALGKMALAGAGAAKPAAVGGGIGLVKIGTIAITLSAALVGVGVAVQSGKGEAPASVPAPTPAVAPEPAPYLEQRAARDALAAAIAAFEDKIACVSIGYEILFGEGPAYDPDAFNSPGQVRDYLKSASLKLTERNRITFNRKQRVVLFDGARWASYAGMEGWIQSAFWLDFGNALTKSFSNNDIGSALLLGQIAAGAPLLANGRHEARVTPLLFMYWPFGEMQDISARLRKCDPVDIASESHEQVGMMPSDSACGQVATKAYIRYLGSAYKDDDDRLSRIVSSELVWLAPGEGYLPIRRDRLCYRDASTIHTIHYRRRGLSDDEFTEELRQMGLRPEDYVIGDRVAVPKLDVKLENFKTSASFWILSTGQTEDGVVYPTEMVWIVPQYLYGKAYVSYLKTDSFETFPADSLVNWELPAGTYVRDERAGVTYQMEPALPSRGTDGGPDAEETIAGKMTEGIAGATHIRRALRLYLDEHGEFPELPDVPGNLLEKTIGLPTEVLTGRNFQPENYKVKCTAKDFSITVTLGTATYTFKSYGVERRNYRTIAGEIVMAGDDARPVPAAIVRACEVYQNPNPSFGSGQADAAGRFELRGPIRRVMLYSCSPDGALAVFRKLSEEEDHEHVRLSLAPAAGVTGRLLDEADKPSAKPKIEVRASTKVESILYVVQSIQVAISSWSDDGAFSINGLPPGEDYEIVFSQDKPVKRTRTIPVRIDDLGLRDLGNVYWNEP